MRHKPQMFEMVASQDQDTVASASNAIVRASVGPKNTLPSTTPAVAGGRILSQVQALRQQMQELLRAAPDLSHVVDVRTLKQEIRLLAELANGQRSSSAVAFDHVSASSV